MSEFMDVYEPVAQSLRDTLKIRFDDKAQRAKVVAVLVRWLTYDAKKKPVLDLKYRLSVWEGRFRSMVEHMQVDFTDGKLQIKVAGSDETTLKSLQFGSDWFVGNDDLMATIWMGLFED